MGLVDHKERLSATALERIRKTQKSLRDFVSKAYVEIQTRFPSETTTADGQNELAPSPSPGAASARLDGSTSIPRRAAGPSSSTLSSTSISATSSPASASALTSGPAAGQGRKTASNQSAPPSPAGQISATSAGSTGAPLSTGKRSSARDKLVAVRVLSIKAPGDVVCPKCPMTYHAIDMDGEDDEERLLQLSHYADALHDSSSRLEDLAPSEEDIAWIQRLVLVLQNAPGADGGEAAMSSPTGVSAVSTSGTDLPEAGQRQSHMSTSSAAVPSSRSLSSSSSYSPSLSFSSSSASSIPSTPITTVDSSINLMASEETRDTLLAHFAPNAASAAAASSSSSSSSCFAASIHHTKRMLDRQSMAQEGSVLHVFQWTRRYLLGSIGQLGDAIEWTCERNRQISKKNTALRSARVEHLRFLERLAAHIASVRQDLADDGAPSEVDPWESVVAVGKLMVDDPAWNLRSIMNDWESSSVSAYPPANEELGANGTNKIEPEYITLSSELYEPAKASPSALADHLERLLLQVQHMIDSYCFAADLLDALRFEQHILHRAMKILGQERDRLMEEANEIERRVMSATSL